MVGCAGDNPRLADVGVLWLSKRALNGSLDLMTSLPLPVKLCLTILIGVAWAASDMH